MSVTENRVLVGVSFGEIPGESAISTLYRVVESGKPETFVSSIFSKTRKPNAPADRDEITTRVPLHYVYYVRVLERPKGDLVDVVDRVVELLTKLAMRRDSGELVAVCDTTGVGHPAFAHLVSELESEDLELPIPLSAREIVVSNTMGGAGKNADNALVVPRRDLISAGRIVFKKERIKVAPLMHLAPVLSAEFREFTRRPQKVDVLDPWRIGPNDDLTLATLVGLYVSERFLRTHQYAEAPDLIGGPFDRGGG